MVLALSVPERVIVAFNIQPHQIGVRGVRGQILSFVDSIADTGVCLKLEELLRAVGYSIIGEVQRRGVCVFADAKLSGLKSTLEGDAILLGAPPPRFLTVMPASTDDDALRIIRAKCPGTEVLGVTALTGMGDGDAYRRYGVDVRTSVTRFAKLSKGTCLGGVVAAVAEASMLRDMLPSSMTINTPNIRPHGLHIPNDDQNPARSGDVAEAFFAGADRIIVGRPIMLAKNPHDAVKRTIDQVADAIAKK